MTLSSLSVDTGQRYKLHDTGGYRQLPIKDHYQEIIRSIMRANRIFPASNKPSHEVGRESSFEDALRHTDFYIGQEAADRHRHLNPQNPKPHYRYDRYLDVLSHLDKPRGRVVHMDMGCGAGLFSWALLDWANAQGVRFEDVRLFGYDHCPQMIRLAIEMRKRLVRVIPRYPALNLDWDINSTLRALADTRSTFSDYVITLGHVLVQAEPLTAICEFRRIISTIMGVKNAQANCTLVAVDARSGNSPLVFQKKWESLRRLLTLDGITVRDLVVPTTSINNSKDAKISQLLSA